MKKVLSMVVMVALIICAIPCQAMAANEIEIPDQMIGYLVDENGNREQVVGQLVDVCDNRSKTASNQSDELAATYRYTLYSSADTNSYHLTADCISQYAVNVYLTIHYNVIDDLPQQTLLTRVSGYWTISDNRVTVSSADLHYGCSWTYCTQSDSRSVSNNFNVYTNFTEYVMEDYAVIGAYLDMTMLMGDSRTYYFTAENYLVNNV